MRIQNCIAVRAFNPAGEAANSLTEMCEGSLEKVAGRSGTEQQGTDGSV